MTLELVSVVLGGVVIYFFVIFYYNPYFNGFYKNL